MNALGQGNGSGTNRHQCCFCDSSHFSHLSPSPGPVTSQKLKPPTSLHPTAATVKAFSGHTLPSLSNPDLSLACRAFQPLLSLPTPSLSLLAFPPLIPKRNLGSSSPCASLHSLKIIWAHSPVFTLAPPAAEKVLVSLSRIIPVTFQDPVRYSLLWEAPLMAQSGFPEHLVLPCSSCHCHSEFNSMFAC